MFGQSLLRDERQAVAPEGLVGEEIGHPALFERLAPVGVALRAGGDAEELRAQGKTACFVLRVVESETAVQHGPVGPHARQDIGQPGFAESRASHDRFSPADAADRTCVHDAVQETSAGIVAGVVCQQAGLVVVGHGGQVGVAGREAECVAIAAQRIVAEDPEGHVVVAAGRNPLGGLLALALTFHQQVLARCQQGQEILLGVFDALQVGHQCHRFYLLLACELLDA